MSSKFINGAKYAVSATLAPSVPITAISNANPAIASAGALPVAGNILLLKSGWSQLNDSVARALAPAAGAFTLEQVNTTSVTRFPPTEGVGAYQVASAFFSVDQVRDVKLDGGEQNYFEFQYVEDEGGRQRRKPTFKSATGITFTLDYDPDKPWYDQLITIDREAQLVILRETLPNDDVIYYVGTLAFNKVPTKDVNQNMTVQMSLSLESDPVRFGA